MKRFVAVITAAILVAICVSSVLAQNAVPFRGTVDMPTIAAGKDTVVYRPMGLGGIRSGIADLQDRMGGLEDAQRDLVASFNRHDERVSQPAPVTQQSVHPIWWMLLGGIVGLLVGLLIGRGSSTEHRCPDTRITGPLVQGPLVTCPGHSAPVAQMSDGPDVPIAQIPAIRGTSYRVEFPPPAETTRHTIEELRMDANAKEAAIEIARVLLAAIVRKPEPAPATPPADAPQA